MSRQLNIRSGIRIGTKSVADSQGILVDAGDITQLTTTDKTTLVAAVNEVKGDFTGITTAQVAEDPSSLYFTTARARESISVTDAGGDGSLTYDTLTGVITYTGPSAAEVRAHFSGGTGVGITAGVISIGQDVETTSDVTFNDATLTGVLYGPSTFVIDPAVHGDNTGTVIVLGDLTVQGTTTTINSTTLEVEDKNILLARGAQSSVEANGGGITLAGANAALTYASVIDSWGFNKPLAQGVDGTAALPSYTFSSDSNTGIFRSGTDELSISTDGVSRVSVTASGDFLIRGNRSLVIDQSGNTATLSAGSLTASRTFTLPNVTGTVITTGDTGTVTGTIIANETISNTNISPTAAIADTKLDTIATAGKVSNSATTATSLNTPNTIVLRDGSGSFLGNSSTATALETARNINGTSFNGTANITTEIWGTARDITIGGTTRSVNGSQAYSWSLTDIGVNNATLTLATSGIATGSQTWTSNQGTNATFTVDVPGTNLTFTAGSTDGPVINSSTGTGSTLPSASGTASGVVTTGTQTFAGVKTFSSTITGSVSGNAGTADKLSSSRTFTLSGDVTGTVSSDLTAGFTIAATIPTSTVTSAMIVDGTIVNADISATAAIAVSKLANGTARQLLQTNAAGNGTEWTSNVSIPGTLSVTGISTFLDKIILPEAEPTAAKELGWSNDEGAPQVGLNGVKTTLGADTISLCRNASGSVAIAKGTAVMFAGTLGMSGRLLVAPMVADGTMPGYVFFGIAADTIAPGADGYVKSFGKIRGVNTSAFAEGAILWCDPAVPGGLTATEPEAPNLKLSVAAVVSSGNNGTLMVRWDIGRRLSDLHDVESNGSTQDGEILQYNASAGRWENRFDVEIPGNLTLSGVNITESARDIEESRLIRRNGTASIGVPGQVPFGVGPVIPPGMSLVGLGPDAYNSIDIASGSVC